MKNIVTIGGGTGQYCLLQGLKNYDINLTAVVNIIDSGGSSGSLRASFGVLPPGDIRNCLIALADDFKMKDLIDLFAYRFKSSEKNNLNHNLGNLILTALSKKYGNFAKATQVAGEILNIRGKVLPVSIDDTHLYAKTNSEKILKGEAEVSSNSGEETIEKIWIEPEAFIYSEVGEAVREADLIVICPGEIYGSILPNFLFNGMKEAINESNAKIIYVCNLVTKQGCYNFKASDFVDKIECAIGRKLDYIICNTKKPSEIIVDKYKKEESFFVECNLEGENIIKGEFLIELIVDGLITARHDSAKIAKLIMNLQKMNFKFYIEKLESSENYKIFIKENSDAFLCSCFFVMDKKEEDNKQNFDFYVPSIKKMFSFQLNDCRKVEVEKFEKVPEKISDEIDFDFENIEKMISDEIKEKNIGKDIQKILLSLQKTDEGNFLIGVVFVSGLGMIKININLDKMQMVLFEQKSFFDMLRKS